jgi:hypothetical protein
LQATLIIRHPEDGKLYVNFDQDIFQLIREAKCLDRMGIEIPDSAKIALVQVRLLYLRVCLTSNTIILTLIPLVGGKVQELLHAAQLGSFRV